MKTVTHKHGTSMPVDYLRNTLAAMLLTFACIQHASALPTAGWVEYTYIMPESFIMKAKLDTGADTTSINANNVTTFTRDGSDWTRFTLRNFENNTMIIERPVVRTALIKRHSGNTHKRPVIELALCINGIIKTVEVNLVDRSRFKYQLLIGRNFMRDSLLVDPAKKYILPEHCTHDLTSGDLTSDVLSSGALSPDE